MNCSRIWPSLLLKSIVVALLGIGLAIGSASIASADTTPSPAPGGSAKSTIAVDPHCATSSKRVCITYTLVDANNNPIPDVKISVTAAAGHAHASTKTDADGRFTFGVTPHEDYTVTLATSTLPHGVELTSPATLQIRNVNVLSAAAKFTLKGTFSGSKAAAGAQSFGETLWNGFSQGLLLGLLLALAAIGLSLVYGTTGLSNFAHGEQMTLGGLVAYVFTLQVGLPFWLSTIIAVAIGAASGYLQDLAIWKPLRRRGLGAGQLLLVSIGLSFAAQYLFQYIFGVLPVQPVPDPGPNGGPFDFTPYGYWAALIALIVLIATGFVLSRTRAGRAIRAVADNPALAAASGIDNERIIRGVWTVAMGLTALAGALYAAVSGGVVWSTGLSLLLLMFAAVTLGGIGTAFGAFAGSMIIGVVVEVVGIWWTGDLKYAAALAVFIFILIVRPQGIFGRRSRIG